MFAIFYRVKKQAVKSTPDSLCTESSVHTARYMFPKFRHVIVRLSPRAHLIRLAFSCRCQDSGGAEWQRCARRNPHHGALPAAAHVLVHFILRTRVRQRNVPVPRLLRPGGQHSYASSPRNACHYNESRRTPPRSVGKAFGRVVLPSPFCTRKNNSAPPTHREQSHGSGEPCPHLSPQPISFFFI